MDWAGLRLPVAPLGASYEDMHSHIGEGVDQLAGTDNSGGPNSRRIVLSA